MATVNCILVGQTPCAEVYYIDLEGNYPDYTCPVAMADIKAAYEAGKVLKCRCAMGPYTATLPLFIPMPSANTWIFSGSGALSAMNFPAQSLTIAIANGAVQASNTRLARVDDIPPVPDLLPNPNALFINIGSNSVTYDGSEAKTIDIPTAYTLPIASPTELGGVKPITKTDGMTRSIGVDDSGGLYTEPAAWYVNITGALGAPIGDKTPAEIYQAYTEGYAVYAVVQMADLYSGMPLILPLVAIVPVGGSYLVCFSTLAEPHQGGTGIIEITVTWSQKWYLFASEIARTDDIPTTLTNPYALTITSGSNTVTYDGSTPKNIDIPTALPNPNALTIKTSSDTVSYDGSEAKTMEIADAGELVTETTEILPAYTNQIPLSTDVSGAILNGVGYESGQLGMDGSVTTGTSFVSGFIPVKKGDVIRVKDPSSTSFSIGLVFALYNSSKATGSNIGRYINTMQANASYGAVSISGNVLTWDTSNVNYYFWNNFAYLRVTTNSAASIVTVNEAIEETTQKVMTLKPTVKVGENNLNFNVATALLAGKKVVVFGDSIIGMTRDQTSVPAYAAAYTGAEVYNVGFGGCRMSVHPTNGYAAFSMWALADAVSTGDYTMQNAQASSGSDYFPEQLALLKTIDFNDVDMVVIHYGTNDFAANVAIDNASDDDDTATLCGALRYSLRKLMTAYPKLRIFVSVPIYRKWNSVGAETYTNSNGVKLIDFCEAMARVATEFNCPVMNGFRALGVNTINDAAFSADGTHLNDYGRKAFGEFMGGNLINFSGGATNISTSFKPEGNSYLTFSSPNSFTLAVGDATKHWDGTLEYFASNKTWTTWDGTITLSAVDNDGEYVLYLRGTGNTVITGSRSNYKWVLTGTDISCIGNIENLLDYETVQSGVYPTMATNCYRNMFYGCTSLTQAPGLPATTLASDCYYNMFYGCTSLTQAPALPATTLVDGCYYSMFYGCTSLTQAPALPATTLADYCYSQMFCGCTSLTQAPALPATTLANQCYDGMFAGCTSLTKAPALPATTLANNCYHFMFLNCTSLTQAPALPATTLTNQCYNGMFSGCTSLKLSSTQTGEYTQEYRIPTTGTGTTATDALVDMFINTGGNFQGTPEINTTYYLSTDNMIVRDTEVATLNGYVASMIDVAIGNAIGGSY